MDCRGHNQLPWPSLRRTVGAGLAALGWLSLAGAEPPRGGAPIVLPPLLVEEMKTGPRWRYGRAAGFEVLARCDDDAARAAVAAYHRARAVVRVLLPDRFVVTFDVPHTLVLYDENLWAADDHEAIANLLGTRPRVTTEPAGSDELRSTSIVDPLQLQRVLPESSVIPGLAVEFLRNIRLSDDDAVVSFALVSARQVDPMRHHLSAESLGDLLGRRTPALPSWFVTGFLSLYGQLDFGPTGVELPRLIWLSADAPRRAVRQRQGALMPLAELFAENRLSHLVGDADGSGRWLAQSELWVRWGLAPGNPERTAAFWQFVERAAAGPVDEAVFRACFGRSYAEVGAELAAFLPVAVSQRTRWPTTNLPRLPDFELRDATKSEVARIKGDWERLEVGYVRHNRPELVGYYLAHARKTLARGGRDPEVLAVLALAEIDDGEERAARECLASAVDAQITRPRVYHEHARLLFQDLRDRTTRSDGKIEPGEAQRVIAALRPALSQQPPLIESYCLMADVWLQTAAAPTPAEFALLEQGLAKFPRRAELFYRLAKLSYESGARERADALVEAGLRIADTPARQDQLRGLQALWRGESR